MVHRSSAFPSVHFWFNVLLGLLLFFFIVRKQRRISYCCMRSTSLPQGTKQMEKNAKKKIRIISFAEGNHFS